MPDIKETVELVDAVIALAEEVERDSQDGKLTVLEILGNYPEVLAVINEGKDCKTIVEELKDLDEDEIRTLVGKLITLVFTLIQIVKNLK